MRISDWSSDVCSSDLTACGVLDDGVEFGQTDAHVFGDLVIARFAAVLLFEFADCVGYRTSAAMHRARGPVGLAQFVEHRATNANAALVQVQIGRASCRERVCQYV